MVFNSLLLVRGFKRRDRTGPLLQGGAQAVDLVYLICQ
jgi:hypothetical protein